MRCLAVATVVGLLPAALVWAQEPVRLQEVFTPGHLSHVSCRVELTGKLAVPEDKPEAAGKTVAFVGTSAIDYDERVLSVAQGQVDRTVRIYRRVDFERQIGTEKQQGTLRPAVRRVVLLRLKQAEVPFSPDGPLTWGEIDLVRTDVFTPALNGLLGDRPVRPGDRWQATPAAVEELTDLDHVEAGQLECRFEQFTTVNNRRHARVGFVGTVRGTGEDGPCRQQLDGYLFFDLESNHLSYLYIRGTHFLLDKDGKEMGRNEGRFVLTRQVNGYCPDLTDAALKGVVLEPNDSNTLLLYDNPTLGVRLLHPRRWRVAGVRGRQLALDETNGSGLLLTLEPANRLPSGAQFQAEARDWLQQQKPAGSVKILRADPPRRVSGTDAEQFTLEVEASGQRVQMTYYTLRQPVAGATVAARLLPQDLAQVRQEVEGIVRSLQLSRPVEVKDK